MLIRFFYANGIVYKGFVPPAQTVNQQFNLKVLKRLCDSVWKKKRPEMWSSGDWFLHHDNAPAHMVWSVQQFLVKKPHDGYPSSSLFIYLTLCHATFSCSLV